MLDLLIVIIFDFYDMSLYWSVLQQTGEWLDAVVEAATVPPIQVQFLWNSKKCWNESSILWHYLSVCVCLSKGVFEKWQYISNFIVLWSNFTPQVCLSSNSSSSLHPSSLHDGCNFKWHLDWGRKLIIFYLFWFIMNEKFSPSAIILLICWHLPKKILKNSNKF